MKYISSQLSTARIPAGKRALPALTAFLLAIQFIFTAAAATKTWDGSSDGSWANGANWSGNTAPVTGDDLVFPAGISRTTMTNTLSSNIVIDAITFLGSNYVVTGNVGLTGGISCEQKSGTNTFNNGLFLSAPQTFQCTNGTGTLAVKSLISLDTNTLTFDGAGSNNISARIDGAGGVTKQGQGVLTYSTSVGNTYTGQTWVRAGLMILNAGGLFTKAVLGPLVVGDASDSPLLLDTLRILSDDAIAHTNVVTVNATGIVDIQNTTVMHSLTINGGSVTVGTGGILEIDEVHATSLLFFNGITFIFRSASISGPGPLTAYNNDHYLFDVDAGAAASDLIVTAPLAIGASGAWSLFKTGDGLLELSGTNDYRGTTSVSNGVVQIDSLQAMSGTNFIARNGAIQLDSLIMTSNKCTAILNSAGTLAASGGSNFWSGPIILSNNAILSVQTNCILNVAGAISGPGSLTKEDVGLLLFTGSTSNTYAGTTFIHAGTLQCDKSIFGASIPGDVFVGDGKGGTNADVLFYSQAELNPLADVIVTNSGLYRLGGDTIGSLSGNGNVDIFTTGLLTVGGNNASTTFSGTITDGGALTKAGTGTFTLSGNNNYTGPTTVSAGTLVVNGSQQSSAVTVRNGATLKGKGAVGNVNVATGGTLAPGTSPGRLTTSSLVLSNDAVLQVELNGENPGTDYDQLQVNGSLTITGSKLVPTLGFPPFQGESFTIAINNGSDAVVGTFDNLANGSLTNVNGIPMRILYNDVTGNDITLTVTNLPAKAGTPNLTLGNANAVVDPNECDLLSLRVTNATGTNLFNVHGTLLTSTPGVIITRADSDYPNLVAAGSGTNLSAYQFFTTTNFLCGQSIEFLLDLTASNLPPFAARYVLQSGQLTPSKSFTNNTAVGIPPVGSTASPIVVSNITGGIAKVTVSMDLVDTSLADLELLLIPPAGPAIVLAAGLPGTQLGTNCANGRLTFDDDAAQPIEAGSSPYVGTFRCDVPLSTLDGLTGSQVNGPWLLEVIDFISNTSSGSIVCWSLNITPANCTDGGGPCDVCNGPFTDSITTNDLPIAARVQTTGLPSVCGVLKTCPVPGAAAHYDLYTFTNGGPDSCVLVTLDSPCTTSTNALAGCAAYLNAFNPANICQNYLGDIGSFTNSPSSFSVTVPAGAVFVIVVCGARDECGDYSLTVNGFDCAASLGIGRTSNGVRLNWPTYATDYKLESATNLASPNWRIVTGTQTANNGDFVITNNPSVPQIFYRLHKP